MIQHQITGLGPVNADGSMKIFTRLPAPFIVTAALLKEQSKAPAVGDVIEVNGSQAISLVTEQRKPVIVHAAQITAVSESGGEGEYLIEFADGSDKIAHAGMTARMTPSVGDYWVISEQGDGVYEYLNPKAVFEAKYAPLNKA